MTIRFLYLLVLILPVCVTMHAQNKSWIGTTEEWRVDENWSPNGIPTSTSNVIISAGAPNWPKLDGPVEINSLTMNAGSQLDVNGSKITVAGAISITGSTVSNTGSGPATMETKGGSSYLRNSVFANGLDFTATDGAVLNEADATGPNTYDGNVKFTIANSNTHNFSAGYRSVVNGNLVIERTVAGTTNVLTNGSDASTAVMGDFSYINKAGGPTTIGGVAGKTIIAGKVDIEVETTGSNPAFTLQRLANNTTGGVISILNPGGFNLYNDTLTVAGFTVAGKKFSNSNIDFNKLTFGTFLYEDDPANNAPLYISRSEFNGPAVFTLKGGASFNEGWNGPNTYNGNTVFRAAGLGELTVSGWSRSFFNGDLTIERTVAGTTNGLTSGAASSTAVTGNFSYINKAGGPTVIGGVAGKAVIEGKVDIEVETTGSNPAFTLQRLANNTTGGVISILNPGGFNLYNDTLTVAGFTVSGKKFSNSNIDFNRLTFGTFLYEDDPANNAPLYISRSEFNGPAVFTLKGTGSFNEGWEGPNTYNGNTVFNGAGLGELTVSGWSRSLFNGDLTIERTVAGTTNGLTSGAASSTAVTGNFSYINKAGGPTTIGGVAGKAVIEGKVDIEVETTGSNPAFTLQRLANNTTGGVISILNPGGFNLYNDTLTVAGFTVAGKKFSNSYIDFNQLTFGTFLYEDDPANNAPLYISRSEFNGPAVFTLKGTGSFNEGWEGPNTYNGNTVFNGAGPGELTVSGWSRSFFNGDLAVERTATGTTNVLISTAAASTAVTGDFSYKNKIGGATTIGGISGKTIIAGKVDIEVDAAGNPTFTLQRLANNTTGGEVSILNPGGFNLLNDTLTVAGFTVSGKQFSDSNINYSKLTSGSFLYEDAAGNNGQLYMSGNEFNGPAAFTLNGSGSFNDGWVGPNQYNGHVTYTRNGSSNIVIGHSFVLSYAANLAFASAAGIIVNAPGRVRFNGATDGTFTHTGVAEPVLPGFILEKTEGAKLVLTQPLRTSNTVSFVSGYIQASEANPLIFQGGTNHTGTSDDSHVLGPVHKIGNTEFTFPIGSGEKLFAAGIGAPSSPTDRFSAEFLAHNPGDDSYDPDEKAGTLIKVFDGGYWDIQPVAPTTGNVTVTLGYNFPSGYISDPSKLAVAHWNGTLWDDLGNGGTSGSNTVGTVSTAAAVPAFSPFTIASTEDANPLPVVLAGFSASKEGAAAVLRWTTTDEANSDRFEIEHSTDARMWSMIGKIAAKQERNIISDYTYIHTNPFTGINYYRLKMVDHDGSFAYSRVEKVTFPGGATLVLYPNPVSERLFMRPIAAAGTGKAEIYTVAGRRVWSGDMPALQEGLDISGLPGGLYLVRVSGPGTQVETVRVLVER